MDYEGHLERLLRVATCLAACGYAAQVGALVEGQCKDAAAVRELVLE